MVTALCQRRAWCHNESVQTEQDDQKESKLVNLLSALQVKILSTDRVQDAMTSLLLYQLFNNAFSKPLIIHQC